MTNVNKIKYQMIVNVYGDTIKELEEKAKKMVEMGWIISPDTIWNQLADKIEGECVKEHWPEFNIK